MVILTTPPSVPLGPFRLHHPEENKCNRQENRETIMKIAIGIFLGIITLATTIRATELHVATDGVDSNPGTNASPLLTIQRAADLAQPGDVITVHAGIYRERVNPPRGGESDTQRIVYQAAPGEKVEIKGSEIIKNWVKVQDDVWKVTLPNSFFGDFNPYSDLIRGDWFDPKGRQHHTGAVYLNGNWLYEAKTLEELLEPVGSNAMWFGRVDATGTTIWAQFKGVDPNAQLVEINKRRTVFYPDKPGRNYITVRGFAMSQAATNWAPPTTEQIGLIGTNWSKNWIIDNNTVCYSMCSGISLGKYGNEWDTRPGPADGPGGIIERIFRDSKLPPRLYDAYERTIDRALAKGWNRKTIGHHVVRKNKISHCEQAGIVGSLGCAFSVVTGNTIHHIHVRQLFRGAEMAGIKFHGAVDVVIRGNHIYHNFQGIWLDWMAQGTQVSGNLFHDNSEADLKFEANHGPILVGNNVFLSETALIDMGTQGGAFVHNLIAGGTTMYQYGKNARVSPFFTAHSTKVVGVGDCPSGDHRFYNNLFVQRGDLGPYDAASLPVQMEGNVFLKGAKPSKHEKDALLKPDFDPALKLIEKAEGFYLQFKFDKTWAAERTRKLVTTDLLGKAIIPNLPYEEPDGTSIRVDTDYFSKSRNESNPTPGPFENIGTGSLALKMW